MKPKYMKKIKLPTSLKSKSVWCRNCNCKNPLTNLTCLQCEHIMTNPSKVKLK